MNPMPHRHLDRIQEEIATAETSLAQVSQHLRSSETELATLDAGLKDATARRDSKHGEALEAGERIKEWFQTTKDEVIDKLEDWKTDIEIHRVEKDADRKEDHARDAIILAAHALLEAEVALVEALKARKLAIELAG